MADPFSGLIARFRTHWPELQGAFSADWSAKSPDYRLRIRQSLQRHLAPSDLGILDLDRRPQLSEWSISISHCPTVGGWAALPRPSRVGVDMEEISRIKLPIIERISLTTEISAAPHPEFLWCAKEAFFKALDSEQPSVMTELQIGGWSQGPDQSYLYIGEGPKPGKGCLIAEKDRIISVCVVSI